MQRFSYDLGGVIIEITNGHAMVHHGGLIDASMESISIDYAPIEILWQRLGISSLQFDMRGWTCRVMAVIEDTRIHTLLNECQMAVEDFFVVQWDAMAPMDSRPVEVMSF